MKVFFKSHLDEILKKNPNITRIEIPEGIEKINDFVFKNCNFEQIKLPSTLREIGIKAFQNCDFSSIEIPDSVEKISYGAFSDCEFLQKIRLPQKLKALEKSVFMNCSDLMSVELPENLEKIEENAFKNCSSLCSIKISNPNIIFSPNGVFSNCTALKSFELPENSEYECKDSCVFRKIDKRLIFALSSDSETFVIPPFIEEIEVNAFSYNIKHLEIKGRIKNLSFDDESADSFAFKNFKRHCSDELWKELLKLKELIDSKKEKVNKIYYVTSEAKIRLIKEKIESETGSEFPFKIETFYRKDILYQNCDKEDINDDMFYLILNLPFGFQVQILCDVNLSESDLKTIEEFFRKLNIQYKNEYHKFKYMKTVLEDMKIEYLAFDSNGTIFDIASDVSLPSEYFRQLIEEIVEEHHFSTKFEVKSGNSYSHTSIFPTFNRVIISFSLEKFVPNLWAVSKAYESSSPFSDFFENKILDFLIYLKTISPDAPNLREELEIAIPEGFKLEKRESK